MGPLSNGLFQFQAIVVIWEYLNRIPMGIVWDLLQCPMQIFGKKTECFVYKS